MASAVPGCSTAVREQLNNDHDSRTSSDGFAASFAGDFSSIPDQTCRLLSDAMQLGRKVMGERLTHSSHPQRVPEHVTIDGDVSLDGRHLFGGRGAGDRR